MHKYFFCNIKYRQASQRKIMIWYATTQNNASRSTSPVAAEPMGRHAPGPPPSVFPLEQPATRSPNSSKHQRGDLLIAAKARESTAGAASELARERVVHSVVCKGPASTLALRDLGAPSTRKRIPVPVIEVDLSTKDTSRASELKHVATLPKPVPAAPDVVLPPPQPEHTTRTPPPERTTRSEPTPVYVSKVCDTGFVKVHM